MQNCGRIVLSNGSTIEWNSRHNFHLIAPIRTDPNFSFQSKEFRKEKKKKETESFFIIRQPYFINLSHSSFEMNWNYHFVGTLVLGGTIRIHRWNRIKILYIDEKRNIVGFGLLLPFHSEKHSIFRSSWIWTMAIEKKSRSRTVNTRRLISIDVVRQIGARQSDENNWNENKEEKYISMYQQKRKIYSVRFDLCLCVQYASHQFNAARTKQNEAIFTLFWCRTSVLCCLHLPDLNSIIITIWFTQFFCSVCWNYSCWQFFFLSFFPSSCLWSDQSTKTMLWTMALVANGEIIEKERCTTCQFTLLISLLLFISFDLLPHRCVTDRHRDLGSEKERDT